ncbi:hypothetical protein [Streptomyces sp. NPDC058548]|uniref:hypothetical protein n=1 Tax=unclassified Streptomyces TaxID=2593676 RepID=UPI0036660349
MSTAATQPTQPARPWRRKRAGQDLAAVPGSVLRPVGSHLVIAPPGDDEALAQALQGLRAAPGALVVLAAAHDAAPVLRASLPELTRIAAERDTSVTVLAASGLAAAAPDGNRPVVRVAEALGSPVIAPNGLVSIEPDGTLLVTTPDGGSPGQWWRCTPSTEPVALGPVWPTAPDRVAGVVPEPTGTTGPEPGGPSMATTATTPTLTAPAPAPAVAPPPPIPDAPSAESVTDILSAGTPASPAVRSTAIPRGRWITRLENPTTLPVTALDPADAGPDTLVLAVGTPENPHLSCAELLSAAHQQTFTDHDWLLTAPWAEPDALVALATALADALGRDVRASIGLPLRSGGVDLTSHMDAAGVPSWLPFLTELTASPARGRVVPSAWHVLPGFEAVGPASHRALEGWVLEAVPAGLWLRPEGSPAHTGPRLQPRDPGRPLLVVGEQGRPVTEEVLGHLGRLLDALPGPDTARPGLMPYGDLDGDTEAVARFLARRHGMAWVDAPTAPMPVPAPAPVEPRTARTIEDLPLPEPDAVVPIVPEAERPEDAEPDQADLVPSVPSIPSVPVRTVTESVEETVPEAPSTTEQAGAVLLSGESTNPAATPEDRHAVRSLLGEEYQQLASRSDLLANKLPGLRSTDLTAIKPDLAAILVHHADSADPATRAQLVAAARTGTGPLLPLLRCLGSGLRKLPSHHGPVLLGAPAGEGSLSAESLLSRYEPGTVLAEPGPVSALPVYDVALGATVEFGIWSTTGRRTAVFGGADEEAEVVFPPGTRFSVLGVEPADDTVDRPARVLLRELPLAESGQADEQRDRQARERLLAWFERRDAGGSEHHRTLENPERFHLTPGLAVG